MKITCPHCNKRTEAEGPFPIMFWTEINCMFCNNKFEYKFGQMRKMNQLREEIKEIVLDAINESVEYAFQGKIYNPRITSIMDNIVSRIEKRIDGMINEAKEDFGQSGRSQFDLHEITGKLVALERVKQEMLK